MIICINFSHPLNEEAERTFIARYCAGEATIYQVAVQLDTEEPLTPQLDDIAQEVLALPLIHGNAFNVDCIIPPGHSVAAGYFARRFPGANLVVMTRRGTPPQFVPTELVRA
jgi:hypothetical protein